jgi:hypothetical protein
MGTYAVGYWGHPYTLLHGDADHCPGQVVGLNRPLACPWTRRGLPLVPVPLGAYGRQQAAGGWHLFHSEAMP